METITVLNLWAKTDREGKSLQYLPLLNHMIDVAAVAGQMWDNALTENVRRRFECGLGSDARDKVVFLSGAHDIGKASPGFQKKMPRIAQYLDLPFSAYDADRPHGHISAVVLNRILGPGPLTLLWGQIAGGHHGVFPRSGELQMGQDTLGNAKWNAARVVLLDEFTISLGIDLKEFCQRKEETGSPFLVPLLAGFISVVDWIGSNQQFFSFTSEFGKPYQFNALEYFKNAQGKAQRALGELGWIPRPVFATEVGFEGVFPDYSANSLQQKVCESVLKQDSPYLLIVEAPMGTGKTEAALFAADLALCRGFASGLFVAMPTQATSNAMFKRVLDDYLKHRKHQGKLNLQLVHSGALLAQIAKLNEGEISFFRPENIDQGYDDADTEAQSWFAARKRPLLAPFGVGTIDQSLLSVLQTKHWFVRLFGLAGKVIIFDEVHAYDAYMSTILERLLHWLSEMDCSVILLSATLPEYKRRILIEAYSGRTDAEYQYYPRLTLVQSRHYPCKQADRKPKCEKVAAGSPFSVNLGFANTGLFELTKILNQKLESGGCAAVICNTVDRSIEVYRYLRDNLKETECLLFHARTLQKWRREREEEVLLKFGKGKKGRDGYCLNSVRPQKAVLVSTQVIEQSLDLDFDLMISEMAPIDLLFQRMGRLHRHLRLRPKGLELPEFIVLCKLQREGPPGLFGDNIEYVYDRYILLKTWLAIKDLKKIELPDGIEGLIEEVYGSSLTIADTTWTQALDTALKELEFDQTESSKVAKRLLVLEPHDPVDLIGQFNTQLVDEEDPGVHKAVRAATREGDPSIPVVMLNSSHALSPELSLGEIRDLLDNSVKLSHRGVYQFLAASSVPDGWAENTYLRYSRLVRFDENSQALVNGFCFTVDEKLGIMIEKENKQNGRIQLD